MKPGNRRSSPAKISRLTAHVDGGFSSVECSTALDRLVKGAWRGCSLALGARGMTGGRRRRTDLGGSDPGEGRISSELPDRSTRDGGG